MVAILVGCEKSAAFPLGVPTHHGSLSVTDAGGWLQLECRVGREERNVADLVTTLVRGEAGLPRERGIGIKLNHECVALDLALSDVPEGSLDELESRSTNCPDAGDGTGRGPGRGFLCPEDGACPADAAGDLGSAGGFAVAGFAVPGVAGRCGAGGPGAGGWCAGEASYEAEEQGGVEIGREVRWFGP
jgi:hypothetical protein